MKLIYAIKINICNDIRTQTNAYKENNFTEYEVRSVVLKLGVWNELWRNLFDQANIWRPLHDIE